MAARNVAIAMERLLGTLSSSTSIVPWQNLKGKREGEPPLAWSLLFEGEHNSNKGGWVPIVALCVVTFSRCPQATHKTTQQQEGGGEFPPRLCFLFFLAKSCSYNEEKRQKKDKKKKKKKARKKKGWGGGGGEKVELQSPLLGA